MTPARLALVLAVAFGVAGVWIAFAWRGRPGIWPRYWLELLVITAIFAPAWAGGPWPAIVWTPLALMSAWELARAVRRWPAHRALGALLVALPFVGMWALLALARAPEGFWLVVFCFGLVEINDAAALLIGGSVGRRRVAPSISPDKTVAGIVAGIVASLALAVALAPGLPQLSAAKVLIIAIVLAVTGPVVDLAASWVKRRAGLKDFSRLVPVHGGVLDVYDSLLGAAPVFLLCLSLLAP